MIELLLLINMARINPLILDVYLSSIATQRAEIVYNTEWSHKNWEKSFEKTDCNYIGENLASGFTSIKDLNNALLNSPSHKEVITNQNYQTVGLGSYKNITVELFCGKIN